MSKIIERALVPIQTCDRCKSRVKLSKWKIKWSGGGFWTCPVCGEDHNRIKFEYPKKNVHPGNAIDHEYLGLRTICVKGEDDALPPGEIKTQRENNGNRTIITCYFNDSKSERNCALKILSLGYDDVAIPYSWSMFPDVLSCFLFEMSKI